MKHQLLLLLLCVCSLASAQQFISPSDHKLAYIGRWDFTNPEQPTSAFPGTQIYANFRGSSLALILKPYSGHVMVNIDNRFIEKIDANGADSIHIVTEMLDKGSHQAIITFCNEGLELRPVFKGLLLADGDHLTTKPSLPSRKIEFIGDSHTCGYGVEASGKEERFSTENSNVYYSFASVVARTLNAQAMITARSGNGVYRNYNGPITGSENNLPARWDRININDPEPKWDFSLFTPDVVCVTLGDNDCSAGSYDTALLFKAYYHFYEDIRHRYPKAQIIFVSSPALEGKRLADQQQTIDNVVITIRNGGDTDVTMFRSYTRDPNFPFGADYHMGKQQQATQGRYLAKYIAGLMGW